MIAQAGPSWQRVIDGNGLSLSITGMLIVFLSLVIITTFIALLPKVLVVVAKYFPEKDHHAAPQTAETEDRVIAAIGYILHERLLAGRQGKDNA